MTKARRLVAVVAGLAVTAIVSSSFTKGEPTPPKGIPQKAKAVVEAANEAEALAKSRFEDRDTFTYEDLKGQHYFALQVKPQLPAVKAKPRDILILVSASAAQGGPSWTAAQQLAEGIINKSDKERDRISLWTVSTPEKENTCSLTEDFQEPLSKEVQAGLDTLKKKVYPAGATDLKNGLQKAIASFRQVASRQRIILFLGDGQSTAADPITTEERQKLIQDMIKRKIVFFSVPLGDNLSPENLHGFATGTGGMVLRTKILEETLDDVVKRYHQALSQPVLYPTRFEMSVAEYFPTKLPPLRSDSPTLVVGKYKAGQPLTYTIKGNIAKEEVVINGKPEVAQPELDNYFLISMVDQWKNAKTQPALIRADRALASAARDNRLEHEELLLQAELAVRKNALRAAEDLFQRAKNIDPRDRQAQAGINLVEKLKFGKITQEMLEAELKKDHRVDLAEKGRDGKVRWTKGQLLALAQKFDKENQGKIEEKPAPAPDKENLLQAHRDRVLIEKQKMTQAVETALRQARRDLDNDPDAALEMLRTTLLRVRDHPDLGDRVRDALLSRLQSALRDVTTQGKAAKLRKQENLQHLALVKKSRDEELQRKTLEERTEAQFNAFKVLLLRARVEEKARQDLIEGFENMQAEARLTGTRVPVAAKAAYDQINPNFQLRQMAELKRVRQDKFLSVMLSIDKSAIPYPDEPGIFFPPLKTWEAITKLRKEKYEVSSLPNDDEGRKEANSIQKLLKENIDMKKFHDAGEIPLKEALALFMDMFAVQNKDLPILVDVQAFEEDNPDAEKVTDTVVKFPAFPKRMAMGTALRLALSKVKTGNATYLIRRNYIEITTVERQTRERVLRVYPVGDLTIPISQQMGGFGMGGGMGMMGGMPMMGGGGMMGMMGGGMNFMGGSFMGGFNGGMGMMGSINAPTLIKTITQIVAPGEWFVTPQPNPFNAFLGGGLNNMGGVGPLGGPQLGNIGNPPPPPNSGQEGDPRDMNTISFFPPAMALIIRAPSRVHTSFTGGLIGGKQKRIEAARMDAKERGLIIANDLGKKDGQIAGQNDEAKQKRIQLAKLAAKELDATKIWQDVLEKENPEPGLVIATADLLFESGNYKHAAEFLKANLRRGIIVRPWVYEALAIALEQSNGDPEEIRRARLSAVALDPKDSTGFMEAARTLAQHKQYDRALAFCRQAAQLEPNLAQPYADALAYAELGKDSQAMEWAVSNVLGHDWPADNQNLQLQAQTSLEGLVQILRKEKRDAEADRLEAALQKHRHRDLVITLSWENGNGGSADLDLVVKEPCGSTCSMEQRQTPGGGTLLANHLTDMNHVSYVAAQAFSGEYEIIVRRNWGQTVGNKAKLKIVSHLAGTAQKLHPLVTLDLNQPQIVKVKLVDGRRTTMAVVPPTPPPQSTAAQEERKGPSIYSKLYGLAHADFSGAKNETRAAGWTPGARLPSAAYLPIRKQPERTLFQTGLTPMASGVDLTAQAVLSADRQSLRLSVTPFFQSGPGSGQRVNMPLIPGGSGP
jgi:tetratricopeptide (TPR) repeat protein